MPEWAVLSFGLLILLAIIDVSYRYLIDQKYTPIELVVFGLVPTLITAIIYAYLSKQDMQKPKTAAHTLVFAFIGILSFAAFAILRYAQKVAPNIGYVNAIMYSSVLVTIVATSWLYKDHISAHAYIGAVFIIIGIYLLTKK